MDDGICFDRMMDAFEHLEVSQEEINEIFQVVGAVLHLGNVEFEGGDAVCFSLTPLVSR
jgi:myosin heavy subunit